MECGGELVGLNFGDHESFVVEFEFGEVEEELGCSVEGSFPGGDCWSCHCVGGCVDACAEGVVYGEDFGSEFRECVPRVGEGFEVVAVDEFYGFSFDFAAGDCCLHARCFGAVDCADVGAWCCGSAAASAGLFGSCGALVAAAVVVGFVAGMFSWRHADPLVSGHGRGSRFCQKGLIWSAS